VLNALNFEDHFILDNEIETISAIELDFLVRHRQGLLSLEGNSTQVKFMTEAFLISGLKETRA
jgi:hypothetical protein